METFSDKTLTISDEKRTTVFDSKYDFFYKNNPLNDFLDESHESTLLYEENKLHTSPQYNLTNKVENYSSEMVTWIGFVQEITNDTFSARLRNLYANENDVEAEFSIKDVMEDDIALLKNGACFYYSIGYVYDKGQRKKEAILKFKRRVDFDEDDLENNQVIVEGWENKITWE